MKNLLSLLVGAALGIAGTYYFTVTRPAAAGPQAAHTAEATNPDAESQPAVRAKVAPAAAESDSPRKAGNSKFGGGKSGFLPEEIDGVSSEDLAKFRGAFFKTFQDEDVQAAREKMNELRKEAEYASDDQKKNMKPDFDEATENLRKATKAALLRAEPTLSEDAADKIMTSLEERMKARGQGQKNAKKAK